MILYWLSRMLMMKNENIMSLNFRDKDMSFHELYQMIQDDRLLLKYFLKPKFNQWSNKSKSRYIESILIRAPLTPIILNERRDDYIVIDGLQRIKTINEFMEDEFSLNELIFLHEFNGMNYSMIHRAFQRRIEETNIHVHMIHSLGTPELIQRLVVNYL